MAERGGFEPPVRFDSYDGLANRSFRPLRHLSALSMFGNIQEFQKKSSPCNQFFHQAPGSDEEINAFCTLKFNTKFTRFKKIEVRGDNANPLYKWLITQNEKGKPQSIKWNFTKFLINRQGEVVARFAPTDKPEKFAAIVKEELQK